MSEKGRSSSVILRTRDLEMTFRAGNVDVHALRGVDIDVARGEFVSIMGNSGSGKSTLLHIIGGLLTPTRGEVFVENEPLSRLTDSQKTELRRERIGFVFQRFNLFPRLTVAANLKLAARIYTHGDGTEIVSGELAEELLDRLEIRHRLTHRPTELSGGEQQRVAIARALLHRPAILLADEPTGNLDTESAATVLATLKLMNQRMGQTILMITHNPEAAGTASRQLRMRDGRFVA